MLSSGGENLEKKIMTLLVVFLCTLIVPTKLFATSWAYPFVVWDGYIYIVNDEYVTDIDKEIGQVTRYSDMYQQPGNFSNVYEKGTKYYSIKGVSTDESIAVDDGNGNYKKAVREKEYTFGRTAEDVSEENSSDMTASLLVLSTITIFVILIVLKKIKR
jgi:hypothetical protein